MEFKMCDECLKNYGALVASIHPPVILDDDEIVLLDEESTCCGDPDDCVYAESGECDMVGD